MPPKKTASVATAATEPASAPAKKPAAAKRAPKKALSPTDEACSSEPKKRNMSAVPCEFVTAVSAALPDELNQKLKVKDVKEICETFVKTLVDKVKKGDTVSFTNHMTFKRQQRKARTYKNLKTGESINKPPHYVICMQVKPALKKVFDEVVVVDAPAKGGAAPAEPSVQQASA